MTNELTEANHRAQVAGSFTGRRFDGLIPKKEDVIDVTSLGKSLVMENERKVDFTKMLASRILELPQVPYERSLRNNDVTRIIKAMKRDTFRPELVRLASCICEEAAHGSPKGTEFRMNGQHTSWAITEMPDSYQCPGKIVVALYRAKTAEDMRLLYSSIDRGAPRTRGNVIVAHLTATGQFKDLSPTFIRMLSEGYSFYMWPTANERQQHDADDLAFLMQSNNDGASLVNTVVAYLSASSIRNIDWLRRSPVIAAMYTTFEKAIKASGEFWDAVSEGVGFANKNDPRLRLRDALMNCKIRHGSGEGRISRGQTKSVSSEEIFRWSINAWNAWRNGEKLMSLRAGKLSAPRPKAK